MNQQVDIAFHLSIEDKDTVDATDGCSVKTFEVGYHYMMFHNMDASLGTTGALSDAGVREAIDIAIDRSALETVLPGAHGTRSLFPDFSPYYTEFGSMSADASTAGTLLDAAGWALDSTTGYRMKDGEVLSVKLVAYPFRAGLGLMQPSIEADLEAVGINVTSLNVDLWSSPYDAILSDGSWDLLMWAQNTLPAGDPAWFLNAFFRSDGGNNFAGLNSATVDSEIDDLELLADHTARVTATAEIQTEIMAEVAVSNLVTPAWHVGVSDRMTDYEPYGSDYYIINADLFVTRPVVVGMTWTTGSLDPRYGSTPWSLTTHGLAEKLFTVDKNGEIVGQVASSTTQVSDYVWDVTLKTDYKFSDGTVVTGQIVADCLNELNTENSAAQSSLGTITATAPDATTVRITSTTGTHVMDAVLAEWVFTVYLADATAIGNFLFTGPYAVQSFAAGDISLVPNEYYWYVLRPDHAD